MTLSGYKILIYLYVTLHTLPVLFGLWSFKRLDAFLRLFLYYLFISLASDLYAILNRGSETWLFHFYTLFEFTYLTLLLATVLESRKAFRYTLLGIVIFAAIWLSSKFTIEPFDKVDSYTSSLSFVTLAVYALFVIYKLVLHPKGWIIYDARFWVSGGILLYGFTTIFTFPLFEYFFMLSWSFHTVSSILANLFYLGGFLSVRRNFTGG